MPATQNSYVSNIGTVKFTIDATAATATGLPAGTYDTSIVLRRFEPTEEPERSTSSFNVTGGTISRSGGVKGRYVYEMEIVDDFSEGADGELGTDPNEFTCVELLWEFWQAEHPVPTLVISPAGASTGKAIYTVTDANIDYVQGPSIDADSEDPATRTARMSWDKDNMVIGTHA